MRSPDPSAGGIPGQRGAVAWLTGLSGAGKSTIARACAERLREMGAIVAILDGDELRKGLCSDLGFSREDRTENLRRAGAVAALMADAGLIVLAAFIAPERAWRDALRAQIGVDRFLEVFVDTPLEVCEQRDPKGLYRKARQGLLRDFTGIDAPYEPPLAPDVVLPAATCPVRDCAGVLVDALLQRGFLGEAGRLGRRA